MRLEKQTQSLKEVNVRAKTKLLERKIDRTILNISGNKALTGADAIEAINLMPGVKVRNEAIQVAGKGSVGLLVDNKLLQLSEKDLILYLHSLPASMIERIELITSPPARFDTEGNTGLIHVVLKKTKSKGTSGVLSGSFVKASSHTENLSASVNFNSDKVRLNVSPSFRSDVDRTYSRQNIYYPETDLLDYDRERRPSNAEGVQINIEATVSARAKLGLTVDQRASFMTGDLTDQSSFRSKTTDSLLITDNAVDGKRYSGIYNLYYESKLDTSGKKISLNVSWLQNRNDNHSTFQTHSYDEARQLLFSYAPLSSGNNRKTSVFTAGADMVYPTRVANLELGMKITLIDNNNYSNYHNFGGLAIRNSSFLYDENTAALYVSLSKDIGKLSVLAGLRAENTQTTGNSLTLDQKDKGKYTKLFPTFNLNFKPNDDHSISFSYGRRIRRPSYAALDPFRIYNSVFSYTEGNPRLEPSYSNNFELAHLYKDFLS